MLTDKRRYSLIIWGLGLGYYLSYTPYSGLTKALSSGLLPGTHGAVLGPVLLPVSAITTSYPSLWKDFSYKRRTPASSSAIKILKSLRFISLLLGLMNFSDG